MIFGVADLVSFTSRTITLEPGDVLITGTPAGVGMAADPPRYLRPGDRMRIEIDGVGELDNTVRASR
jgi:2-keto-4-pentenoate hydratase/2-oxohepta-3-ene-1,7-dioic acid hydratase in catechol pathway